MPIDPRDVVWDRPDPSAVQWDDAPKKSPPQWSDLPANIGPSAARFVGGLWDAVSSPLQTIGGVADLAAGGLRGITPAPIRSLIDKADPNPEAAQRASATADALVQFYKDRYGGLDQAKNTLITDPVGTAADVSTALGIGGAVAPGKIAPVLQKASALTNPLSVVKPAAKAVGAVGKHALGLTTMQGPENVAQAARAGYRGDTSFWKNLTGQVDATEVLDEAKAALAKMRAAKSAEYRSGMVDIKADKSILDFGGIDKAVADARGIGSYKGQAINPAAAKAVQSVADAIDEWKALAPDEFHTPEGLDALKQKVGGVLESIPFEERTARTAVGKVYNAVKDEIKTQAPTYAKVMKQYSDAADQITEIEKALSLGDKAAKDTALRKLQSLARNNVNANYGHRLTLAKELEKAGGASLLPSLAGQSMNTWQSRGLVGQASQLGGAVLGGYGAATGAISPLMLPLLAASSPKAVGGALYGGGRLLGKGADVLGGNDMLLRGLLLQRLQEAEQE